MAHAYAWVMCVGHVVSLGHAAGQQGTWTLFALLCAQEG